MRQDADCRLFVVLAASLLATLPIWIPTFPPMTDLPQHAAEIALLLETRHPGFPYVQYFDTNWFTPYLLGYLLVYALVPLVGIITACKLVVSVALASLPLSTALVMGETGTDRRWALLVIPGMYGFSYQWGFLNFIVAAPLGMVFLWLALRQAGQPTIGGAIALGAGVLVLFFAHALTCAFFGLMAVAILGLNSKTPWSAIKRLLPLVSVVPIMSVWGAGRVARAVVLNPTTWDLNWFTTQDGYYSQLAHWTSPGGWGWGRAAGFFPRLLGSRPGVLTTLFGVALFLLPAAAGARFSRRLTLWIPLIVCIATLLFLPGVLLDTSFVFQRFCVFALPLFLMTLQPPERQTWPRWTWPACALLATGWIGVVVSNTARYEAQAAGFDEILAHMEPGQRALSLIFDPDSDGTIAPSFLHFPSWYGAVKGGLMDPSLAAESAALVHYRPEHVPVARLLSFEWRPGQFNWARFRGGQYRYFVARAGEDLGAGLLRNAPCQIRLVHHVNSWWLYEKSSACAP